MKARYVAVALCLTGQLLLAAPVAAQGGGSSSTRTDEPAGTRAPDTGRRARP